MHKKTWLAPFCTVVLALGGCGPADPLQAIAEDYVRLALALDVHKSGEVDAWFGPAQLEPAAGIGLTPADLRSELEVLASSLQNETATAASDRHQRLEAKLAQMASVLEVLENGQNIPFAEEAQRLYGITLPQLDSAGIQQEIFAELSALLPGSGSLARRVATFRNKLLIPADRRKALFERALAECRTRTQAHWQLPAGEALTLEWTRDVSTPWHSYEGDYRSVLQVNDLTLAYISTPVDVACHEGYPGHHAQFVLFEQAAAQGLPVEDRLVLLRSPESALREGAANLGVDLAFPAADRLEFEREVLFPMAGLDPDLAETNLRLNQLLNALAIVTLPIIQEYRDGIATYNATTFELDREALVSNPGELLQFVDDYGAYSIGYTLLRDQLETHLKSGDKPWESLAEILRAAAAPLGANTASSGTGLR